MMELCLKSSVTCYLFSTCLHVSNETAPLLPPEGVQCTVGLFLTSRHPQRSTHRPPPASMSLAYPKKGLALQVRPSPLKAPVQMLRELCMSLVQPIQSLIERCWYSSEAKLILVCSAERLQKTPMTLSLVDIPQVLRPREVLIEVQAAAQKSVDWKVCHGPPGKLSIRTCSRNWLLARSGSTLT